MGGSVKFEDALAARLSLMAPTRARLAEFLSAHPPRLSPGIPELVSVLRGRGCEVYLVSGGFRAVIHPIAESLGIPLSNVHANQILFNVRLFCMCVLYGVCRALLPRVCS
jgi:phosphoserine phosphatase